MSDYTCPICSHAFNERSALCEDWRTPEKSFGCPQCKTFLAREMQQQHWSAFVLPVTMIPFILIFFFEDSMSPDLEALSAAVVGIGGVVTLYFLWKRRRVPSVRLTPYDAEA